MTAKIEEFRAAHPRAVITNEAALKDAESLAAKLGHGGMEFERPSRAAIEWALLAIVYQDPTQ